MGIKRPVRIFFVIILTISLTLGAGCSAGSVLHEAKAELSPLKPVISELLFGPGTDDQLFHYMKESAEAQKPADPRAEELAVSRGSKLTGNDRLVYKAVRKQIKRIASGKRSSTNIRVPGKMLLQGRTEFTASDLKMESIIRNGRLTEEAAMAFYELFECDYESVAASLIADLPYELYWYDSVSGGVACSSRTDGYEDKNTMTVTFSEGGTSVRETFRYPVISMKFSVVADYSRSGAAGTFAVDASRTGTARSAAERARGIVERTADKSDLQKLEIYREVICRMTDYDYDVYRSFSSGEEIRNTDPWQMITVFDDDPKTQTLCAGYARAFQFLCDLTDFDSPEIGSRIVSGRHNGGWHMWNVVHMDDGKNYIVDITGCDTGQVTSNRTFLRGCEDGSISGDGGVCRLDGDGGTYQYDRRTLSLYDSGELTISDADYGEKRYDGAVPLVEATPVITMKKTSFNWTGKEIRPEFTVKVGDEYLTPADYIASFSDDNTSPGIHKMTITLKGRFRGSGTAAFRILPSKTEKSEKNTK